MPYTNDALDALQDWLNRDEAMSLPANWYFSFHLMNALTASSAINDTTIAVTSTVASGAKVVIEPETPDQEERTVTGVTGAGPYVLTLDSPLLKAHTALDEVLNDPGPNGENTREPSGGAFARTPLERGTADFASSSAGQSVTATTVLFPTITASLGTATHLLKWSAVTAGTLWEWWRLSRKTVIDASSNPLQFPAGNIVSRFVQR